MTTLTKTLAAKLIADKYAWAVVAQYSGNGYERGDLISKHHTVELADKAAKGNTFAKLIELKYVD